MRPIVLITGANGFVGRHVALALAKVGWHVRLAHRSPTPLGIGGDEVTGLEIGPSTDWKQALSGVQVVVHLAACAHRSISVQQREEDLYFAVNVDGTIQLARSAATAGVRHLIFLSSIAVNGSATNGRAPFNEEDAPAPNTVYGSSKADAEEKLRIFATREEMNITVIRAPMIYGVGASGNFQRLTFAVQKGIPLPFSLIRNQRAFLGIDNLISFITHRLSISPVSNFDVFLLADDQQVSTPRFISELARATGTSSRLFPIPIPLLQMPLRYFGLDDALLSSLQMNTAKAKATGWRCPLTLAEGLVKATSRVSPLPPRPMS
jgi:UDP-glucose 4-epimerase